MKTKEERENHGAPEKPAEPKLRRVREKFFSEKKLQKIFQSILFDFGFF